VKKYLLRLFLKYPSFYKVSTGIAPEVVFHQKILIFFAEDATTRRRSKAKRARAGKQRDPDYEKTKPKLTFRNIVARLSILQENCS
jgi:hypothetical protein